MKLKSYVFTTFFLVISLVLIAQNPKNPKNAKIVAPASIGYSVTEADARKTTKDDILGNDISIEIKEGDASWQDKAKIVITNIASDADYTLFELHYDDNSTAVPATTDKTVPAIVDKDKKVVTYNLKDVIQEAKAGIFALFYNKTSLRKFRFKVSKIETPDKADGGTTPPVADGSAYDVNKDNTLVTDAYDFVPDLLNSGYYNDDRLNVYRKKNIVIIYVDAQGHLIKTPLPTTGIRNFKYEIHLIKRKKDVTYDYKLYRPDGGITDAFNIDYSNPIKTGHASASGTHRQPSSEDDALQEIIFPPIGPYESDFKISLTRKNTADGNDTPVELLGETIKVAKFYYASVQGGLLGTTLRNPQNITTAVLNNGDTTLTADDPKTRGIFSIMAVFYPKGRSMLFPPQGSLFSPERFGIVVGTQLDKDQFENFLGGLQFDFARGGSVSFGAHYGRRTVIEGNEHFNFGKDKFTGSLENVIKKEWNLGFFIGVNIDVRIFNFLFGGQPSSNSGQ